MKFLIYLPVFCCILNFHVVFVYAAAKRCMNTKLFACQTNGQCLDMSARCDGYPDCPDGSDEDNCPKDPCENKFTCRSGKKCIDKKFLCDATQDCPDGDDEDAEQCRVPTACPPQTGFLCRRREKKCIPKESVCDKTSDCLDSSDEAPEACAMKMRTNNTCQGTEFRCNEGTCIPENWRCNKEKDCTDGTDELNCGSNITCSSVSHFQCVKTLECVTLDKKCDGRSDCLDGSDERNCEAEPCFMHSDFSCGVGLPCIDGAWHCDGKKDCENGKDEENCTMPVHCPDYEVKCLGKGCLPNHRLCDGIKDCDDNYDEANCSQPGVGNSTSCDLARQFDCYGNGAQCVPLSAVCDNKFDCGNKADEHPGGLADGCQKDLCAIDNGNCSHYCVNRFSWRACVCPHGFTLLPDNTTCVDVDECAPNLPPICSQICINIKGAYKCDCLPGYTANFTDSSRCLVMGEKFLLFATEGSIREMRFSHRTLSVLLEHSLMANALEIHTQSAQLFYSDIVSGDIVQVSLQPTDSVSQRRNQEVLVSHKHAMVEALAFDWIHGLLFWTDSSRRGIYGVNVTSRQMFAVLENDDGVDKPRGLAVDPSNGRLYWTDWGRTPKIEAIFMNGQGRTVLVSGSNISQPNGLTLDHTVHRLYYGDAEKHILASYDLRTGRTDIIVQHEMFHPFGVDVLEDRLYWSDWLTESIQSVDKFTGQDLHMIVRARKPMGMKILHELRQPRHDLINRCQQHRCSHICIPVTLNELNLHYSCVCPMKGWTMEADGFTCQRDGSVEEPTVATPLDSGVTTFPRPYANETISTQSMVNLLGSDKSHVYTISVVSVLMLVVIVFFSLAGYCVRRNYLLKAVSSVNFHNPAYKKFSSAPDLVNHDVPATAPAYRDDVHTTMQQGGLSTHAPTC